MRWITAAFARTGPRAPACLDCEGGVFADTMMGCRISCSISRAGILFAPLELLPGGGAKIKPDWISGLLIVLLTATLWAFFSGAFPYPYGWIVLLVLLVMRLTAQQKQE